MFLSDRLIYSRLWFKKIETRMKKAILLGFAVLGFSWGISAQDMIITQANDTIRCLLHLPPLAGEKLIYYLEGETGPEGRFILCKDVKFLYEGTTGRHYYLDTNSKWVEIEARRFWPQPEFRNRMKIAGGVEFAQHTGIVPVVQAEYIRYQWKNFGIGAIVDYSWYTSRPSSEEYVNESVYSLFAGPVISGRFYNYNTNSFLHAELAAGYYAFSENPMRKKLKWQKFNHFSFLATLGWEILFSHSSMWAFDLSVHLYPDGWGVSAGIKLGK